MTNEVRSNTSNTPAEKAANLLKLAENASTDGEAHNAYAAAARVMARHGLTTDDIKKAGGDPGLVKREVPVGQLWGKLPYGEVRFNGLGWIAQALGVYVYASYAYGNRTPKTVTLSGDSEQQIDNVLALYASIQRQADAATLKVQPRAVPHLIRDPIDGKNSLWTRQPTPAETKKYRRSALTGYLMEVAKTIAAFFAEDCDGEEPGLGLAVIDGYERVMRQTTAEVEFTRTSGKPKLDPDGWDAGANAAGSADLDLSAKVAAADAPHALSS